MPVFTYEASDDYGNTVTGVLDAPDKSLAVEELQKKKYFPISIELQTGRSELSFSFSFFKRKPISSKELLNFTQQLATLLKSGLEIDRCLSILYDLLEREKSREIVKSIQEAVHGGEALSDAMAKQEKVFPPFYLNMVRAGEAGGFLEKVFDRLSYYLENRMKLVESIRSALVYPIVLFVAGAIAVGVLMAYVIPKFAGIFETMGGELPGSTMFLVGLSDFVSSNIVWIIIALVAASVGVKFILNTEKGKRKWDALILKLPLFGSLVQKTIVAQFTRTLGTLLQSGVPIINSLAIVKDVISNTVVKDALERTMKAVKEGKRMSAQLKATGLFPPLATHMILVGEESGRLDEMMLRMAHIYDDEVETAVKRLLTLMEPAMILIMGTVVGFVVISMLTAIFSVNDLPF